jgi:hypothetical protein
MLFFFPPSHEFFYNVFIFLISSIGFLDDPCYLSTNKKFVFAESNKKFIQNNPLNKKEGHNFPFS